MAAQTPMPDPKALKEVTTLTEALAQAQEKLGKAYKSSSSSIKGASDDLDDLRSELGDVSSDMKDVTSLAKKMITRGAIPLKDVGDLDKKFKDIRKQIKSASTQYGKGSLSKKQLSEQVKIIKNLKSQVVGIRGEVEKSSAGADFFESFKSGPKQFQGASKSLMGFAGVVDKGANKLLGMEGTGAKVAGTLLKSFGGVAGGVSKMMTGPVGWVAMGIKGLWDMGMAADEFVKNANKRFAYLRGPDIMTPDVARQFKDFNDQLYDVGKNIQVGLNSDQVAGFVEALTQAGTHLDKLSTGFSTYRDAVYVAAKASKTLGVDLPQIGNMMGELINEFRMNLDDVDKLFVQTAFNAKKAGLTTDKFWNAVENASASMAFWGVSMDGASKMMTAFSKAQVMGAKDTASTVEEVTQSFIKMTDEQRAAVVDLAGGVGAVRGALMKGRKEWAAKVGNLKQELELKLQEPKTDKTAEEIDKLKDQLASAESKVGNHDKALAARNAVELAPYLPMASENTMGILTQMMKNQGVMSDWAHVNSGNALLMKKISDATGYTPDLILKLSSIASEMVARQDGSLSVLLKNNKMGKLDETTWTNMEKQMDSLNTLSNDGVSSQDDIAASQEMLTKTLEKSLGVESNTAKDIAHMVSLDKSGGKVLLKQLKFQIKTGKIDLKEMLKARDASGAGDEALLESNQAQEKTQEDLASAAERTFKNSVEQTLSFKEMQKIAGDEIAWRATSLGVAQAMNKTVAGIFTAVLKGFGLMDAYQSEQSKIVQKELKATGYKGPVGAEGPKSSQIFAKGLGDQLKKLDSLQSEMDKLNKINDNANESLKKVNSELEKPALNPTRKKELEFEKKTLEANIIKIRNDKDAKQEQIEKQKKTIELLGKVSETNANMLKFQKFLATNSVQAQKDMATDLSDMIDNGDSLQKIIEKTGLKPEEIKDALEKGQKQGVALTMSGNFQKFNKDLKSQTGMELTPDAEPAPHTAKGGVVTSPTKLWAGEAGPEAIIPLKSPRAPMIPTPTAGGTPTVGTGAGKNITINVSANEKDLAQKIANEIRAVMYRDQLTGQG